MDKLIEQVEYILEKQRLLEKENEKLQNELTKLKENQNKPQFNDYEDSIRELNNRLDKILT
ncbi:MAG: Unknown protein [uncultured Sulfurovum sp.]|uniref:Uncharacterized protein n=1 Tax=uncultured Sulfurovum sp. TaxID=269237 RepID=A0A6S6SGZ1_9BACT|nr:MAG: Unknown protein [uncultured Sulfurovum sp.]